MNQPQASVPQHPLTADDKRKILALCQQAKTFGHLGVTLQFSYHEYKGGHFNGTFTAADDKIVL